MLKGFLFSESRILKKKNLKHADNILFINIA